MRTQHRICDILAKNIYNLKIIMKQRQAARMKDVFLNNHPVIFKSVNVMKAKETLRNSLRLKKIKET